MSSTSIHGFEFYGKVLENVCRFVYLGWIIVRKLRNCDDEQAAKQAGRLYAAAHESSQAYGFTKHLDWDHKVAFAKTFGGIYAPECYTNLSTKALSKLRAAHRYLFMRLTGWIGVESVEEESTVSSLSIGSDDSAEEYYDTRSRWLYAYAAATEKRTLHSSRMSSSESRITAVDHLKPAPSIEYQLRKGHQRIAGAVKSLGLEIDIGSIKLSAAMAKVLAAS